MPTKPQDIIGKRFNRWTVKAYSGKSYWLCVCDCGTEKQIFSGNLVNGKTMSCGCWRDEKNSRDNKTHGLTKTVEYRIWAGVKRRCFNMNDASYPAYGGSGVMMCRRWSESFEAFLTDMGNRPSPQHTIDRIDNTKGYEPGNCRWATRLEQAQNKTNNRIITLNGISNVSAEWARVTGIHRATIEFRLDHGWSVEDALTVPVVRGRNQFSWT